MTPALSIDVLLRRLAALQLALTRREIALAVLTDNTDIFYYTGSVQPQYLLVPVQGDPLVLARKALTRITREVAHLPVRVFAGTQDLLAILEAAGLSNVRRLGLTLEVASYTTVQRLQRLLPHAELVDVSWDIRTLRMVKSPEEIEIFTRAGRVMAQIPEFVRRAFRPGMSELELSAALEYALRLQGHGTLFRCRREGVEMSAYGVCAAGERTLAGTKFEGICGGEGLSAAVPYGASAAVIERGSSIVIDFAFVLEGYHLDQTRMACWGEACPEVARAFSAMLEVQQAILQVMTPGALWEKVYRAAVSMAEAQGYADSFMGVGREQVKFVGHGVGLAIDEPPFLAPKMPYPLEVGMVIAVEPKVALPGIGVVGIEDTVVIREVGPEFLTVCPREIITLE